MNLNRLAPLLLLALAAQPAWADSLDWLLDIPEPPSSLSLELGASEDANRDLMLDSDLAFIGGTRLLAGYSYSRVRGMPEMDTESYRLGLTSDPLSPVVLELLADHWGQKQSLLIDTAQGRVRYQLQHWNLALSAQLRLIDLAYTHNQQTRRFEFSSRGLGAELAYFSAGNWQAGLSYLRQNYSRDTRALSRRAAIRRLSPITLALSSSLEDQRLTAWLGYTFEHLDLRLAQTRIRSSIDGLGSAYTELGATVLLRQWHLLLRLGRQHTPSLAQRSLYASLGLGHAW